MPALQKINQITLEQYESMSEPAEIFQGEIYNMSSPSQIHQMISVELTNILYNYIKGKKGRCKVFNAPFDVKLSDNPLTIVQPDIMIVCDKEKLDGKRCNGAPDFIIEIVSMGNASDDYVRKLFYYKEYGVREYWIVDPYKKSVLVNFFEAGIFSENYSFTEKVKVNLYDDLTIDFSEVLEIIEE